MCRERISRQENILFAAVEAHGNQCSVKVTNIIAYI
jgi:hypothetical protein